MTLVSHAFPIASSTIEVFPIAHAAASRSFRKIGARYPTNAARPSGNIEPFAIMGNPAGDIRVCFIGQIPVFDRTADHGATRRRVIIRIGRIGGGIAVVGVTIKNITGEESLATAASCRRIACARLHNLLGIVVSADHDTRRVANVLASFVAAIDTEIRDKRPKDARIASIVGKKPEGGSRCIVKASLVVLPEGKESDAKLTNVGGAGGAAG